MPHENAEHEVDEKELGEDRNRENDDLMLDLLFGTSFGDSSGGRLKDHMVGKERAVSKATNC